jgi:hypothetical protein
MRKDGRRKKEEGRKQVFGSGIGSRESGQQECPVE